MGKGNLRTLVLFALSVALLPLLIRSDYYLSILIFMGINAIVVMGLSLLIGYAGQISLGHAAFIGIGAYCSGVLTVEFGFSIVTAFLSGIVLSVIMAMAIAIPTLKLKGHYLAVATLGFGEIIYILFNELLEITGGPSGLSGVPPVTLLGYTFKGATSYYYLVWTFVILLLLFSLNVIHSRIGRALRAIHGSDVAAEAMGVDVSRLKVQVFVLSAVYASMAGSLYAHFVTFISPPTFGLFVSILLLMMVVIGGSGSIWGALLGTAILTLLPEYLRAFKDFDILVYGVILMVILLFMPEGLVKGITVVAKWLPGCQWVKACWTKISSFNKIRFWRSF
ncbi:MAG: branched-chain amino acid ABC transporter permease [Desulfobacterales bacterium]|nr:branched-chain amino acid ABC transporter permease [Desulfobacterales bacterium]